EVEPGAEPDFQDVATDRAQDRLPLRLVLWAPEHPVHDAREDVFRIEAHRHPGHGRGVEVLSRCPRSRHPTGGIGSARRHPPAWISTSRTSAARSWTRSWRA